MTFAELNPCQGATFAQTAYSGVATNVTCNPGNMPSDTVYLCKVNNNSGECEESTGWRYMANLSFTMAQVSPADQGVYWCAFRGDSYRGASKKIELSVKGEARPKNRPWNNVLHR